MQKQEYLLGSQHAGVSYPQVETPKYKFILLLYIVMGLCVERAVHRMGRAQTRPRYDLILTTTNPLFNHLDQFPPGAATLPTAGGRAIHLPLAGSIWPALTTALAKSLQLLQPPPDVTLLSQNKVTYKLEQH